MRDSSTSLTITYQAIASLRLSTKNPCVHSDKQVRQIAQSIKAFGFSVPILVDDDLNVMAGQGRLQATRLLGWQTVPVIKLAHLTEAQRSAFIIADNRLTENSSWDERLLGEQLKILSEMELDFVIESTGFETTEIDLLIDGCMVLSDDESDSGGNLSGGNPFWQRKGTFGASPFPLW